MINIKLFTKRGNWLGLLSCISSPPPLTNHRNPFMRRATDWPSALLLISLLRPQLCFLCLYFCTWHQTIFLSRINFHVWYIHAFLMRNISFCNNQSLYNKEKKCFPIHTHYQYFLMIPRPDFLRPAVCSKFFSHI